MIPSAFMFTATLILFDQVWKQDLFHVDLCARHKNHSQFDLKQQLYETMEKYYE
jgi:hypothetical protein